MKQSHRARQRHVGAADHKHLALHAAQICESITRSKATAVNHLPFDLTAKTYTLLIQPRMQRGQGCAGVKMPLIC